MTILGSCFRRPLRKQKKHSLSTYRLNRGLTHSWDEEVDGLNDNNFSSLAVFIRLYDPTCVVETSYGLMLMVF